MERRLEIKDWFLNNLGKEKGRRIHGRADAVFGETEKAYHVMFDTVTHPFCAWVPKSVTEWVDVDPNGNGIQADTIVVSSYEEAKAHGEMLRAFYC